MVPRSRIVTAGPINTSWQTPGRRRRARTPRTRRGHRPTVTRCNRPWPISSAPATPPRPSPSPRAEVRGGTKRAALPRGAQRPPWPPGRPTITDALAAAGRGRRPRPPARRRAAVDPLSGGRPAVASSWPASLRPGLPSRPRRRAPATPSPSVWPAAVRVAWPRPRPLRWRRRRPRPGPPAGLRPLGRPLGSPDQASGLSSLPPAVRLGQPTRPIPTAVPVSTEQPTIALAAPDRRWRGVGRGGTRSTTPGDPAAAAPAPVVRTPLRGRSLDTERGRHPPAPSGAQRAFLTPQPVTPGGFYPRRASNL